MLTSGSIHYILSVLNIPVHIRDICVFLAPLFSGLTAISTYFLTKELWSQGAGLFAACFIAIVPGYISRWVKVVEHEFFISVNISSSFPVLTLFVSRSVAGSYDNEGIAIFALMFTYYLWIKAVKTGSMYFGAWTAMAYFYMVSAWGGYVFIINLIPLHVLVLILMGRFSHRIYVAYNSFFIIGLLSSMQIPFVGFLPVSTSEHMASAGVFGLLQIVAFFKYMSSVLTKAEFKYFLMVAGTIMVAAVLVIMLAISYSGSVAGWSGRFYSLWDTGYAKIHIPIIASVSEHQPTTWFSFFFDLHILACVFPVGLWYCIKNVNDERVFIILYAISAVYFAGVMVRLMLTLTPCVCILAAIAFSKLFSIYLKEDEAAKEAEDPETSEKNGRLYDKVLAAQSLNLSFEQKLKC